MRAESNPVPVLVHQFLRMAVTPAANTPERASQSRLVVYALVSGHGLVNHAIRSALPSLIPLIPDYTEAQQALLLSAFFPGYILTQLPGGAATQHWGGKLVSTVNLWSNAALFLLTPLAARHAGPVAVAGVFAALGLAQGSYVPSSSVMIKAWLPTGPGRPWALRAMELGQRIGPLIAAWSVPAMAARWGWASVPKLYGGLSLIFSLMFQVGAMESPSTAGSATSMAKIEADPVDWAVFRLAPVQACIWSHFASNNTIAVMSAWSPTYFVNNLRCSPTQAGTLLAIPPLVQNVGNVGVALLENSLVARQVPLLTVRRGMTAIGSAIQAGCEPETATWRSSVCQWSKLTW